jgi:nucleoid-associated protein YgaU
MVNPLYIYVGLAAASLGGLVAVSHERWDHWPKSAEQVVGKVETAAPVQPKSASPEATTPAPSAAAPGHSTPAAPPAPPEVKPAKPAQAAATPIAPAPPAPPAAQPEGKSPVPQESELEQELAVLGQPAAKSAKKPEAVPAEKPSFDIVRVDPEGQAVVAGRSEPGWQVDVKINGETKGTTVANERGEWVWVTRDPISPGSSEITVEARREPAAPSLTSDQAVDVVVSGKPGKQALVVLSEASRPSKVMQSPEEQPQSVAPKVALAPPGDTAPAAASNSAPAGPKRTVTLDVVDYDDSGEIIFSGRGSPGATVRLYVDNNPVGDAPVDGKGGWTLTGRGRIAPGQHALRVDELGPSAKVQSRVELPFVRANPAEVAALDRDSKESPAKPESTVEPATPPASAAPPGGQQTAAAPSAPESEPEATPKSDRLAATAAPPAAPPGAATAAPPAAPSGAVTAEPPAAPPGAITAAPPGAATAAPPAAPPGAVTAEPPANSAAAVAPPVATLSESPPAPATTPQAAEPAPPPSTGQQPMGKGQAMASLPEASPGSAEAPRPRQGRVVIQPGNNLWNISRVIYGKGTRYTVIFQANKDLIRNPRLIYPGQIFATPGSVQPESIDPSWRKPLAEIDGDGASPN